MRKRAGFFVLFLMSVIPILSYLPAALRLGAFIFLFVLAASAQKLPGEIRGYKVYRAQVDVQNQFSEKRDKKPDAIVNLGDPVGASVSTSGLIFEIPGEILTLKQSGEVDFLAFRDFRVNNLEVEIEDYTHAFAFEKNQTIRLPQPVRISLGFTEAARAAYREWLDSKPLWQVTGRVFVFGRFRKAGFRFKRVVPIDIRLQIKNPLNK